MTREEIVARMQARWPGQFGKMDPDVILEFVDAACDVLIEENGGAVPRMPDEYYADMGEPKP